MGCINETIASAWLKASLEDAKTPLARAAIREFLADDVHHARLGWAHVASGFVDAPERAKVAAWLPRLFEAVLGPWLSPLGTAPLAASGGESHALVDGIPEYGLPAWETTRRAVVSAVDDVVLPGFDQLGVETGPVREWWEAYRVRRGPTAPLAV
jgi:hypothetical protein